MVSKLEKTGFGLSLLAGAKLGGGLKKKNPESYPRRGEGAPKLSILPQFHIKVFLSHLHVFILLVLNNYV